jgi:predicted regulator of Ras-like GTPase activity (Roadblock/LC7/MglB family)
MSLLVGQLIYTSFPNIGFQSYVSQQVPFEMQQWFLQEIIYKQWDAYNPPNNRFQAAYLYQFSPNKSFFGWLYNGGTDDLGRRHIPYFISYYFLGFLNAVQLETIFTCLEKGPIQFVSRDSPPTHLDDIIVPDYGDYQSTRQGMVIQDRDRQQCHQNLQQNKLLTLFVSVDNLEKSTQLDWVEETLNLNNNDELALISSSVPILQSIPFKQKSISMKRVEEILQELTTKPIGIEGAVLVNSEGQPITTPIGINENSAQIMAGTILYLINNTQNELNWQGIESISIRAQEGHLILTRCIAETFLLIKAGKSLTGLLEGEIYNTVKKLRNSIEKMTQSQVVSSATMTALDPIFIEHCQLELARYIGPVAQFIVEDILSRSSQIDSQKLVDILSREIPNSQQANLFKDTLL